MATVEKKKEEVKESAPIDMNELVTVKLFYDGNEYKDDVFVSVNGENMIIKRGEEVQIPRKFAEVLKQSEDQRRKTADLKRKLMELANIK